MTLLAFMFAPCGGIDDVDTPPTEAQAQLDLENRFRTYVPLSAKETKETDDTVDLDEYLEFVKLEEVRKRIAQYERSLAACVATRQDWILHLTEWNQHDHSKQECFELQHQCDAYELAHKDQMCFFQEERSKLVANCPGAKLTEVPTSEPLPALRVPAARRAKVLSPLPCRGKFVTSNSQLLAIRSDATMFDGRLRLEPIRKPVTVREKRDRMASLQAKKRAINCEVSKFHEAKGDGVRSRAARMELFAIMQNIERLASEALVAAEQMPESARILEDCQKLQQYVDRAHKSMQKMVV